MHHQATHLEEKWGPKPNYLKDVECIAKRATGVGQCQQSSVVAQS